MSKKMRIEQLSMASGLSTRSNGTSLDSSRYPTIAMINFNEREGSLHSSARHEEGVKLDELLSEDNNTYPEDIYS